MKDYFKALAFVVMALAGTCLYYNMFPSPAPAPTDESTIVIDGHRVTLKNVEYTDRTCTLAKASGDIAIALAISCYPRTQVAQ